MAFFIGLRRDDFEYQSAFAALDELRLGNLKPFFKNHFLQDDTLFFMNSEEELRNFLTKELRLPFGQGFKFSRLWFSKYHKPAETLGSPPPETPGRPQDNVQASVESGGVKTLKNVQKKEGINGSPFSLATVGLDNEGSTQTKGLPISHQVIEATSEKSDTVITLRQPENEDEIAVQSTLPRETAMSVSMLTPGGCPLTQELGENQQDLTAVQHDTSNQKCQSELEKMLPQTTPETDRTFILENRKDEPENAQFTRSFGPKTPNEVLKEGQTLEVIQETAKALHGKISGSTEPENDQGNLLSSSSTIEDAVAVDMLTHQSAAANACKKESTDRNLTTCAQNKEAVPESLEDDDQAQEETCKTEDYEREDFRPYQRATSDHKAQDSDGTIYFSKPQEETIEKDEPPLFVNKGSLKEDCRSVVDDHPKDETIKCDKLDEDLKTVVCRIDVSEHEALSWSDTAKTENQANTTNVDVTNELKVEDINDSPIDVTPANLPSGDNTPTERLPISDQVIGTTSMTSDTDKFAMRLPVKEEETVVQSIPPETAMNVSTLSPDESRLTHEFREDERDSRSVQNDRSSQKCQSDLEEMFTQTTPETGSIIVIGNTNDEPDNRYFSGQLSPKSLNEVFKDGHTDDSCISDPMKLLMKAKELENSQGDVFSSSPTREDTVAMTPNNDLTQSDEDIDMLTHQTDQQVQDLKRTSLSKCPKENKEKDAPTFAVNKSFLEVNSVDVDQCEDEASGIPKVEKTFKTTVKQADISDHEVQRAIDAVANENQENATKETEANEKVAAGVDNEPEDRTSIDSSNRTTELPTLLSDTVSSNDEDSHQLTAEKGGNRSRIKSNVSGVVESPDTIENEILTTLEEKSLANNDCYRYIQEDKKKLHIKQEDKMGDMLRGNTSLNDENGNVLNPTTMMKTSTSGDVAISDAAEVLILKEKNSGSEKKQSGKSISNHDADEGSGTSLKQEFTAAISNQGTGLEGQNILLETENCEDVSEPILKCAPRPFGVKGKESSYPKGFVLDAEENREVEFKSLTSAQPSSLSWKIMDKAKKFICACLNANRKGIIYFGVGDSQEQNSRFKRGEILGLDVEDVIDDIMKAFQFVLDDHIKSDDGPLTKGGDQSCVNIEFIPVTSEGNRTNLCVVEIEVCRDWKLCKDNVYYSKCWTEKRGVKIEKDLCTKKLSDFYKVLKDEFDDVAIRTSGASSSVKQHEVNRQVKEPLTAKYKEWKRETKHGTSESLEGPIPDDSDVKRFSTLVRERLRDVNSKDYGYILIANKLPPHYRKTPHLSFLQNIPWLAVFDLFDTASKKDGLHYVWNETTDAPRAKLRSLDDFKEVSSDWISSNDFTLPTRGTTWILNNEEMQKGGWIKCCRDCVYRALSAYTRCFPPGKLLCVFLGLSDSAVKEMVDILECCFSIIGNSASNCVTIISENKTVGEAFIKSSDPSLQKELKECSVSGIPWSLLREIVREMVGPTKFEERGATSELPYSIGQLKEVLNKVIHSWDDLEVYIPNPRLPSLAEDIEKARNGFYKGAQASQTNLFHNHCIPRTLEDEINLKIEHALKSLSKSGKDLVSHVKTVTVPYEPGSGATTLCRRILWNKRKDYRCAVVKAITPATDYQIEQLQGIIYDEKNIHFSPPALVLVDNFPENETRRLTEKIGKRQTKCVILSTFPIGKLSANTDFDITSLKQLDEKEMSLVKDILINITSDSERRRGAEEVLEREKRFIWFGLELFGRDYDKIEKRLQNHINSTLDILGESQKIHEMVLNFCCFLHYYSDGRAILPHPVVSDSLYEASDETDEECTLMRHIHRIFGGLLLEGYNETNGYHGWRPAHSLVSEVVKSRISIEDTAILLLEKIHKGKAYVNKFLKEQVFKLFLDRKRISDTVVLEDLTKDDGGIDLEAEVFGFYEVRTRYSPLIVDILEGSNGIQGALRLLITICQKASQTEEKAYAWQQLARFMGYEMRAKEMDSKDDLHHRLYSTMNKEGDVKLSMPETCIETAHVAVDIAINQQPKYSHHYVTKGVLYLLQLRDFRPEELPNLPCSLPAVIDICRKALEVYDKALSTTDTLNHYSMIGKIQAMVSLLEIVKGLTCFRLESERFTRYLKKFEIPREVEDTLKQEEHNYVQELSTRTLSLFNELFRDVKLRQMTTYDENEIRGLSNAKIRASKLRRTFYEVTGFDKSELSDEDVPTLSSPLTRDAPALYQQIVQDILFKHDENPYSSWANLGDGDVSLIYNLLKPLCLRGFGSQDDLLICCKACLRVKERPSVDELEKIVIKWVARYPSSEWAHLFNYMIHFPTPNGSLAAFSQSAKLSIKQCDKIVREKTRKGFRKSGAEYFLGKGIGLYAFVTSQEFQTKWENKTDFWRSKDISEKLERVCGQKDVNFKGVITYQGIQLRFDDTRYPYESKDDLWFYIGFSVTGPYAYDPVDNDTYAILSRKPSERVLSNFPTFEAANRKDNYGTLVAKRGKFNEPKHSATKRGQEPQVTKAENLDVLSGDFSSSPCGIPVYQEEKPISSSIPHNLNAVSSGCRDNPTMVPNSKLPSSSEGFSTCMLPWASVDNLHHHIAPKLLSYASAVQLGSPRQEEQVTKATTKQQQGVACNSLPTKGRNWKTVQGTRDRGKQKQVFKPKYVDKTGKLHHGSWVLGAEKSKECKIHTNRACDITSTSRCPFAHSWRGDTLQYVCTICTRNNKPVCRERKTHEMYIWHLGPYYKEDGSIWKDPPQ